MRKQLSLFPVPPPAPPMPQRKIYSESNYIYDQNIAKLTDFIGELQTSLSNARYNNTELTNQCISLKKLIEEKTKQESEIITSLRKDVETWKKLLEDKSMLYDHTKRHCYEVEEDKENIVKEHSSLLKEYDQLKNKHQTLSDDHAKMVNLLSEKERKISELTTKLLDSQSTLVTDEDHIPSNQLAEKDKKVVSRREKYCSNENKYPTRSVKKDPARSTLIGKKRKSNYACSDDESIVL